MAEVVALLFVLLVSMTCVIGEVKFRLGGKAEPDSAE